MTHNNSNKKPISATSTDRSVTFLKMHMGRILDVHTEKAGDVLTQILSPNFEKLCFTKFTYKNLFCFHYYSNEVQEIFFSGSDYFDNQDQVIHVIQFYSVSDVKLSVSVCNV